MILVRDLHNSFDYGAIFHSSEHTIIENDVIYASKLFPHYNQCTDKNEILSNTQYPSFSVMRRGILL
jgi:hypothetical protein